MRARESRKEHGVEHDTARIRDPGLRISATLRKGASSNEWTCRRKRAYSRVERATEARGRFDRSGGDGTRREAHAGVEAEIAAKRPRAAELVGAVKDITTGSTECCSSSSDHTHTARPRYLAIKGGVCTGCLMILPAQFANCVAREKR
jgi:hypothetical protein